jgi:hypothetical protein
MVPLVLGRNLGVTLIENRTFYMPHARDTDFVLSFHMHDFEIISDGKDDLGINVDLIAISLPDSDRVANEDNCIGSLYIEEYGEIFRLPGSPLTTFQSDEGQFATGFDIAGIGSEGTFRYSGRARQEFRDLCGVSSSSRTVSEYYIGPLFSDTLRVTARPSYFFPFDRRKLSMDIWISTYPKDNESLASLRYVAPEIRGFVTAPEWDESVSVTRRFIDRSISTIAEGNEVTRVVVDFQRPLAYRVLLFVLLGAMLFFMVALAFVEEIGSFLEVSVGVLLGLWGIQNALIPPGVTETTIIDSLVLGLYVLLAIAIFIRFVVRPIWRKTSNLSKHQEVLEDLPNTRISQGAPVQVKVGLPDLPSNDIGIQSTKEKSSSDNVVSTALLTVLFIIVGISFLLRRRAR